jgi:hypothetical protein
MQVLGLDLESTRAVAEAEADAGAVAVAVSVVDSKTERLDDNFCISGS